MRYSFGGSTRPRRFYNLQQFFPPEWLKQKPTRAAPHRLVTIRLRRLGTDKYDWHTIIIFRQFVLKFQPANAGQLYVDNQASGVLRRSRGQKLLGGIEAINRISGRLQTVP